MNSLLNDLETVSTKKKYQSYLIEMGIEKVNVLIPFELAESFEQSMSLNKPRGSRGLHAYVKEFNGIIES